MTMMMVREERERDNHIHLVKEENISLSECCVESFIRGILLNYDFSSHSTYSSTQEEDELLG